MRTKSSLVSPKAPSSFTEAEPLPVNCGSMPAVAQVPLPIGFLYTAHCNARCLHCSTNCGPKERVYLDYEAIVRTIEEAAAAITGRPLQVCFSGGEPFLDIDLLCRLIAAARAHAPQVTCVTNGFWAADSDSARQVLMRVKASGLTALALSASAYHEPFVSSERVVIALAAAAEVGLNRVLKFPVAAGGEAARDWAARVGCDLTGVVLEEFPVMPHLRSGVTLPETAYRRQTGVPAGPCAGASITYRETGEVFTCCTPGAFVSPLRLGRMAEDSFADLLQRFVAGGLQQILRNEGPSHFVPYLRATGLGHLLRDSYDGVCDLCTHIFSNAAMTTVCERVAEERELATLKVWLGIETGLTGSGLLPEQARNSQAATR